METTDNGLGPEAQHLERIIDCIRVTTTAVVDLTRSLPRPRFIDSDPDRARFRYDNPDERTLQVLMCVRIASGLQAVVLLIRAGKTGEAGVILRTVDEFMANIMFVDEAVRTNKRTADQETFISEYFVDHAHTTAELLTAPPPKPTIIRKKKLRASEARTLMPENPHRVQQMNVAIDTVLDSYVHGAYSTVMELYVGGSDGRFMISSTVGSPRIKEMRTQLAYYAQRALNVVGVVAMRMGLFDVADSLRQERIAFSASDSYPDGESKDYEANSTSEQDLSNEE